MVGPRIARALEQEGGVLLVIAVDHHGVEVLGHQLLNRGKRLVARVNRELEFAENLRHRAGGFFLGAEKERLVTHTKAIVGTYVSAIKLRW